MKATTIATTLPLDARLKLVAASQVAETGSLERIKAIDTATAQIRTAYPNLFIKEQQT